MSAFHSPTIRSLNQNGLNFLLFENEERRNVFFPSELEGKKHPVPNTPNRNGNTPIQASQTDFQNKNASSSPMVNTQPPFKERTENFENKSTQRNGSQNTTNTGFGAAPENTSGVIGANAKQQGAPARSVGQSKKNETLTIEHWPSEWLIVHKRFGLPSEENKSSQIRVAWTYAGLEQDVLGPINAQRQAIIKELAIELNHKKGTHSFIPYSFVQEDGSSQLEMHENVSFFWSAMRLVRPRVLLIFGSATRDTLNMPKTLTPLQKADMGALQILQMHKPETLAQDKDHYAKTVAFLHEYLKFCPKKI